MKRSSGVLMHISSLWGDYSCGSFGTQAKEFINFLHDCGFSWWQTLPFCLPDSFNSPYKSYSAFSLNPMFIDLESLFNEGLITRDELVSARQQTPYLCEFSRKTERINLLFKAASRFKDVTSLNAFFSKHPQTDEFCTFMAKKYANDMLPWDEWKTDHFDSDVLFAWKFIQYKFFTQWLEIKQYANKKGIKIIGDIPIYVDYDSADVYYNKELFQLDENGRMKKVAGVPPDYFCADGQLWGNPLYDWERMCSDGFKWWKARMNFMCELFDGVRIDHFRGLESYFAIDAAEATARNGKWEKGHGMKFINAIKQVCSDKLIIAEDLGVITDEVKQLVQQSGFPSMRVLQFGFLGEADSPHMPHNYPQNTVSYTGTHDNNTLLGFVWEATQQQRQILFDYCNYSGDINYCYDNILKTMFAAHSDLLILPIQDLLLYGNDTRLNKPGAAQGNWEYRITKQQLETINKQKFLHWNGLYGRNKEH